MIEYRLNLAGCECAVAEWNPQGSILVFALHGWLDNLATFEWLVPFMPKVRLVAIDFPGHGHSAHLGEALSYHFIDGIHLLDDLTTHFSPDKVFLLGHSMGGAVSMLFAAARPDKVAGLVSIESLGPLTALAEESVSRLQQALQQRAQLARKNKPVYVKFEQALAARAAASEIDPDLIRPLVERALQKVAGGYSWRADPRLRLPSPMRYTEEQLLHLLANIQSPLLYLEASKGYLVGNPSMQERKKNIAQLITKTVEGGHHIHLQQPESCARQIQEFFEKIS